jgi:hypothetical protein
MANQSVEKTLTVKHHLPRGPKERHTWRNILILMGVLVVGWFLQLHVTGSLYKLPPLYHPIEGIENYPVTRYEPSNYGLFLFSLITLYAPIYVLTPLLALMLIEIFIPAEARLMHIILRQLAHLNFFFGVGMSLLTGGILMFEHPPDTLHGLYEVRLLIYLSYHMLIQAILIFMGLTHGGRLPTVLGWFLALCGGLAFGLFALGLQIDQTGLALPPFLAGVLVEYAGLLGLGVHLLRVLLFFHTPVGQAS